MKCYIFRPKNTHVTEFYIDILERAINKIGIKVYSYKENTKIKKDDIILSTNLIDGIKSIVLNRKCKKIYWMQGIEPEESYMRNTSKLRLNILNIIEKLIIKKSDAIITVSPEMTSYISEKHRISIHDKVFSMPCFNVKIEDKHFYYNDKYTNNIFSYVGSLSDWQCFEETIRLYKIIEEQHDNCKLLVFTSEIEKAELYLSKLMIKNYKVDFVDSNILQKELAKVKYGFCLRKNNKVNEVSTPTKLSSYLASGVIPIFTDAIKNFSNISKDLKYKVCLSDISDIGSINNFINTKMNADEILQEYTDLFSNYYNVEKYEQQISEWLKSILIEGR